MSESATFEPEQGLSHMRRLTMVMGDDDWRERGDHPDWCALENEDGERVYVYAKHTLYLTSIPATERGVAPDTLERNLSLESATVDGEEG